MLPVFPHWLGLPSKQDPGYVENMREYSSSFRIALAAWIVALTWTFSSNGTAGAIVMDGLFDDWQDIVGTPVKVVTSRSNIFVYFSLSNPTVLQQASGIEVLFDTDGDSATGASLHGIGVERQWLAGSRVGYKYTNGATNTFSHAEIQLKSCPVHDSTTFEISIKRENTNAQQLSVAVTHNSNLLSVVTIPYSDQQPIRAENAVRHPFTQVRAIGYNVLFDTLFQSNQGDTMLAELSTLQPDVICFSEIYKHTAAQTLARVTNALPQMGYAVGTYDEFIVSRYPITWTHIGNQFVLGRVQSAAAGVDFIACSAHLTCCTNFPARAGQLSGLKSALQAIRSGSNSTIPTNIPIVLIGDLNLVSFDSPAFGSFRSDLQLTHLQPLQLDTFEDFTWRYYGSTFSDGRLDYALVSQGAVATKNFVYRSATPPSDHLPVVVDFAFDSDQDGLADIWETAHWPNLSATALSDTDGDGMSNLGEQLAGTSPVNPHSKVALAAYCDQKALSLQVSHSLNSRWSIWHSVDLISWARMGLWSEGMVSMDFGGQTLPGFYRLSSP